MAGNKIRDDIQIKYLWHFKITNIDSTMLRSGWCTEERKEWNGCVFKGKKNRFTWIWTRIYIKNKCRFSWFPYRNVFQKYICFYDRYLSIQATSHYKKNMLIFVFSCSFALASRKPSIEFFGIHIWPILMQSQKLVCDIIFPFYEYYL